MNWKQGPGSGMEGNFIKVATVSEIPDRRGKRVLVGDDEVALWHVAGVFYAIGNVCSHQHFSLLHQGILSGREVSCPMHGWSYSLETGESTTGGGRVKTYEVRVEGQSVYVRCRPAGAQ